MDNPLVQPDPGLFIWTILTFLVLLFLLAKFAWGPLLKALEERQETIRKSLDDADQATQELERLHQKSAQIIAEARGEAQSIVAKSRAAAETVRADLKRKAKEEADALVRGAQRQIQLETARAIQQIRHEAGRPVACGRVEAHQEEPDAGRQRRADPGLAQPDRSVEELRACAGITTHFRPPIHPAKVGAGPCRAGVEYRLYAPSSRLAMAERGMSTTPEKRHVFLRGP